MTCAYSKELLALAIENDLPASQAADVSRHLQACGECAGFYSELQNSQSFLKSLRQETVGASAVAEVRQRVLARTEYPSQVLGWGIMAERVLLGGLRKPRWAVAGLAVLAIVSVSLLGQIRSVQPTTVQAAAEFAGDQTLLRPKDYRRWIFVGSSMGLSYASGNARSSDNMFHNVYIDPTAYKLYSETGEFPEGTVLVLESVTAAAKAEPGLQGSFEKDFVALEASVKDSSRFEGGWGYFSFTEEDGKLKDRAQVFPEAAGCRSCHEQRGETDHVFTQFYPVLRQAGAKS